MFYGEIGKIVPKLSPNTSLSVPMSQKWTFITETMVNNVPHIQGDQVLGWSGKIISSPEAQIIFLSPEFFKNIKKLSYFYGYFHEFRQKQVSKECKFLQK